MLVVNLGAWASCVKRLGHQAYMWASSFLQGAQERWYHSFFNFFKFILVMKKLSNIIKIKYEMPESHYIYAH